MIRKTLKNSVKIEELAKVITYLSNQKDRTHYRRERQYKRPIGSGVTEAACKSLIKQRLCGTGMKWKEKGASNIISIQSLKLSKNRWNKFWNYFMTVEDL